MFAAQIRRVADEDKTALYNAGLIFNLHALVGGQLENDLAHKLYLIYPQGNWVEVSEETPYGIIGESGYGKPLLDRVLRYHTSMDLALKVGFLAFDATRTSSTSVEYPLDLVLYRHDTFDILKHRFQKEDLADISSWWQSRIYDSVEKLPSSWVERLLDALPHRTRSSTPRPDNPRLSPPAYRLPSLWFFSLSRDLFQRWSSKGREAFLSRSETQSNVTAASL